VIFKVWWPTDFQSTSYGFVQSTHQAIEGSLNMENKSRPSTDPCTIPDLTGNILASIAQVWHHKPYCTCSKPESFREFWAKQLVVNTTEDLRKIKQHWDQHPFPSYGFLWNRTDEKTFSTKKNITVHYDINCFRKCWLKISINWIKIVCLASAVQKIEIVDFLGAT
jgi:hypothetical protein